MDTNEVNSEEEIACNYFIVLSVASKNNDLNKFKTIIESIPPEIKNKPEYARKFRSFIFTTHAVRNNNIEFLEYLHSINCLRDEQATYIAARNGNLKMLQFLHSSRYEWQDETVAIASTYGHLDCVKFAIENGCPWNEEAILSAVEEDRIEIFKYLYSFNQFPIDEEIINTCIQYWDTLSYTIDSKSECFNYCFQHVFQPQTFWNIQFESRIIVDRINFDDPLWRNFLYSDINLSKHKRLRSVRNKKIKEIEDTKNKCKQTLEDILPLDIIQYCIYHYI